MPKATTRGGLAPVMSLPSNNIDPERDVQFTMGPVDSLDRKGPHGQRNRLEVHRKLQAGYAMKAKQRRRDVEFEKARWRLMPFQDVVEIEREGAAAVLRYLVRQVERVDGVVVPAAIIEFIARDGGP